MNRAASNSSNAIRPAAKSVAAIKHFYEQSFANSPLKNLNIIFSTRGLIILLFAAYLFAVPISKRADIVASVVASTFFLLSIVLFCATIFLGRRTRKNLNVKIFPPEPYKAESLADQSCARSGEDLLFAIRCSALSIAPGFILKLRLNLHSNKMSLATHIISGFSSDQRVLLERTQFPHRGHWKVSHIDCSLEDRFGFTSFKWEIPSDKLLASIRIEPNSSCNLSVPMISSANRSGDTFPDVRERYGDPFDLKQYHPSDGIKKLLWKVYARSGELIARHPEASMTPEGHAIVFAFADQKEDHVCTAALSYLKMLEELNVEICFGCEGMQERSSATNAKEALELLVESVWDTSIARVDELNSLIQEFRRRRPDAFIQNIIFICGTERASTTEGYRLYSEAANQLSAMQAKPVFVFCAKHKAEENLAGSKIWHKFFFDQQKSGEKTNSQAYYQITNLCRSSSWEYFEQEVS